MHPIQWLYLAAGVFAAYLGLSWYQAYGFRGLDIVSLHLIAESNRQSGPANLNDAVSAANPLMAKTIKAGKLNIRRDVVAGSTAFFADFKGMNYQECRVIVSQAELNNFKATIQREDGKCDSLIFDLGGSTDVTVKFR